MLSGASSAPQLDIATAWKKRWFNLIHSSGLQDVGLTLITYLDTTEPLIPVQMGWLIIYKYQCWQAVLKTGLEIQM